MSNSDKSLMVADLVAYNQWAFARVWQCMDALTDEEFCRDSGYSQGSVRDHMVHVVSATRRWIQRLTHQEVTAHLDPASFASKNAVKSLWQEFENDLLTYASTLSEADLLSEVGWQISHRNISAKGPLWQVLLQLFNHATDHRAQILAIIHFCFNKPTIEQDYIFYLAEKGK